MNRLLPLGVLHLLFVSLLGAAVGDNITSVRLTSHAIPAGAPATRPYFLIDADETDGVATTNRHRMAIEAQTTFTSADNDTYVPRMVLQRASDNAVLAAVDGASLVVDVKLGTLSRTINLEMDPTVRGIATAAVSGTGAARTVNFTVVERGRGYASAPMVRVGYTNTLTGGRMSSEPFAAVLNSTGSIASIPAYALPLVASGTGLTVTIDSPPPLDPGETYTVGLRLLSGVKLADFRNVGPAARWLNFTGTVAVSSPLNAFVNVVGPIAVTRPQLLVRGTSAADRHFAIQVPCEVYRYDNWSAAVAGTDNIPANFELELRRHFTRDGAPASEVVSLNPVAGSTLSGVRQYAAGTVKSPSVTAVTVPLLFRPADLAALDFINDTYSVTVREVSVGDDWSLPVATQSPSLTSPNTLRFAVLSGRLTFGNSTAIQTEITSLGAASITGVLGGFMTMTYPIISAAIDSTTGLQFSDPSVQVTVNAMGDCLYNGSSAIAVTSTRASAEEIDEVAEVSFQRSHYRLDGDGLLVDLRVDLPAGLQWSPEISKDTARYLGRIPMPDVRINQALKPALATATYDIGRVNLSEETNPLIFSANSLVWEIPQGSFQLLGNLQAFSFARSAAIYLDAVKGSLKNIDLVTGAPGSFKRSNDHLHASAKAPTQVRVFADATSGAAQLSVEYDLDPMLLSDGAASLPFGYRTHMPYDVRIEASSGGHVKIEKGVVDPKSSHLSGVSALQLSYDRQCTDSLCTSPLEPALQTLTPAGSTLVIAAHGAVRAEGAVAEMDPLRWGKRSDGQYAHGLIDKFTQGVFLAAGSFAPETANPSLGAFAILNTGYRDEAGELLTEAPDSTEYLDGAGDYPGINLRLGMGMALGSEGQSVLGGEALTYTLQPDCKYYTRAGGVSGIHNTQLDGASANPKIYGYQFGFSRFAFNLLSSEMRDSLISGAIEFPMPSDFTQQFEDLRLSCRGELEELTPVGTEKKLAHWNCAFKVLAASFVRSAADACLGGTASYMVSVSMGSNHVPVPLIGNLGLMPDGEIISPADGRYDGDKLITSRFALPAGIEIQGPARVGSSDHEIWKYTSVQDAYLSRYNAANGSGFWSLLGTLDVPFFRDLQVHLHTTAISTVGGASDPDTDLHVMGGWPDNGWIEGGGTPFNTALFDPENRAMPAAMPLATYRSGGGAAAAGLPGAAAAAAPTPFSVKAAQTWLEVVDFDYELTWDPVRKTFEAKPIEGTDILVVNIGHNCLRISPDFAEINFGFSYDGLPQINLSQLAFNAIDDATGAASSLLHSLGEQGFDALTGGVDRFAKLVGDRMDQVIDEHVDAIMGPPLDALDGVLKGKFTAGYSVDSSDVTNAVDAAFGVGSSAAGTIKKQLEQMVNAGSGAIDLAKELQSQLDEVLDALDSCANLNRHGAGVDKAELKDFFDTNTPSGDTVLEDLAKGLVTDLAAAITAEALDAVWAAILEKHEDKVIAVEEAIAQVYVRVKAVRDQVADVTGDFNKELQEIVAAAKTAGEIEAAINQAAADIKAGIAALSSMDVTVSWDLIRDEQKAQWLQIIKDKLHASPYVTKISTAIKERLYDLEARMHSAIDSGMDALNDMLKDAIKDQLAGLDESINNLLGGKLDDIVGAGQIKGYAHITTDSLELLRLDGSFRWMVPDEMKLDAYLEIRSMNSEGDGTCAGPAGNTTEVELGALDVPLEWISPDLRADVSAKFAFGGGGLIGFGGGFRMVGELSYETFTITDMQAQIAFGETENYLAAEVGLAFSSYKLKGGIFFGRCCTPDPIEAIDPDVAALISGPSFTGAYAYGEGWIPIIGNGCFFNISAGVGAGAFYFAEGPTYGGKMFAGVSGEALCAVSIKGEIELIGVKSGGDFSFSGEGRISGKAGVCPFCVKFSENVRATYSNGSWDVDY